jgi:hypothetical protein
MSLLDVARHIAQRDLTTYVDNRPLCRGRARREITTYDEEPRSLPADVPKKCPCENRKQRRLWRRNTAFGHP